MDNPLDNLCIVMIQTSHPGNIGSAARAMKTMGINDLRLVKPNKFGSPETKALASGADDILDNAQHFETLVDALSDCQTIIGTSARSERTLSWPQLDARECGEFVAKNLPQQKIALVFGRERTGLTNDELEHCHSLAHIPMAFDFFSLNIAAAIQLFCYECMMATKTIEPEAVESNSVDPEELPAPNDAIEGFYEHLETTMIESRYLDPENPRLLMRRFRRLFGRANPSKSEVSMLRGMLSAFQGKKFNRRPS
uniref:tRNA (cytidine/uridine-2'-O-)-methyltransferase TrmJ n=1 Tax=uncultured Thiotrichaceae bacterium TaxID=298394 RepID=A0A6S6UGX2_9GAMM|nr:MAG: tRNA:Cm32/Um32 methyltransferase [uncultured Thiotrichaceae bacterium]